MSYWENRAEQRIEAAQEIANSFIPRIAKRYVNTCRAINADIDKILKRFMWRFDLTEEEARELLNEKISIEEIELLKRLLNSTADKGKHADIEKKLNARAYAYRMSRLEALKVDIKLNLEKLAQKSEIDIKDCLQKVTEEADRSVIKDLNDLGNFSLNPGNFFEDIAKQKWNGRNYSQRVWRNTTRLEKRLNDTLITGILRGDNVKRLSMDLMDSMKVGIYEAKRLVRTETTYYTNQTTLKRYEKVGIKKNRYLAALDARTSEICRDLNGKEFNIEDAKVGENYPPMHPHCRSTTVAVIDNVWGKDKNYISSNISARNNSKGRPSAIYTGYGKLNKRQERLDKVLKNYNDKVIIKKRDVNLKDIASLTAHNQVEYAVFTKGQERMVVRGNDYRVNIDEVEAAKMRSEGWKWSGHSHIHVDKVDLNPSDGDIEILKAFGQGRSCIINAKGIYKFFEVK